ncbi:protein toll-like [Zeugodacus cucurbitae]|uniref:protein toll-like n=1 Tax=Zeugodacus cucurbitae TaxID=28588 RepID=UPI0023D9220C|nr:protein toll-like [Zeugodacus cucurbitae]
MLPQSYLTPTTSASPEIATTITPTVSTQHLHHPGCYDASCECTGHKLHCFMNGVSIDIYEYDSIYSISISCEENTTAKEIQQVQFPYHFQYSLAVFEIKNCAVLPEILRRANINYIGTIIFDSGLLVPARFFHNAVGLPKLRFEFEVNSSSADILPAQLFHNQSALRELELVLYCEPYEVTLPSQIFHTLYGLEVISVNANQWKGIYNKTVLRNLTAEHFRDTSNLRKIYLQGNFMQTLSSELFATLTELNELNLSFNDLTALPCGLLRAQVKLIVLNLSNNLLQALPPDIFDATPLLWQLDLSYNQMSVPTNIIAAVQPLRYLYRLFLSYNNIMHIAGAGEFENHTLISRQQIREISGDDKAVLYLQKYLNQLSSNTKSPNMTFIDPSFNIIETFHLREISAVDLRCPYELDFSNNQINRIYALSYPPPNDGVCTRKIILKSNPLQCDCILPWILSANILIETEKCVGPDGSMQTYLSNCTWTPRLCPTDCNCHYDTATVHINCTQAGLVSLTELPRPEQVSLTQSSLDISHNLFFELPPNVTFGYSNVTRLYAAHNRIENIHSAHLQLLNAVRTHRKRIPDVAHLTCANLENISLLQVRYENVCVPESVRLAWLLFSISLVIIVFISLIALYYKYNLEIHVWLYAHGMFLCCIREHELDKDKTFDAFISYAHQDARFVNDILLPGLEQGEPEFSVCTHERNWLAGAYIPEQIIESVAQSRRTIIVLSQHFIESDWARMEFRTAHQCALNERRSRIIIIKYGELTDLTKLDKALRAYLTMNTYLEWVELRYAMPHRKGEVRSAGMLELNERRVYVIGDVERNTLCERDE